MATKSSINEPEEDAEENHPESLSIQAGGSSSYSRVGEDLEAYIRRKEEKRSSATSKGIARRKGLNSGGSLKRTRLNPVSKKQKKRLVEYKKARESHYSNETNQKCLLCGTSNNLSIHHSKGRGSSIAEEESFVTLCIFGRSMDVAYPDSIHVHSGGCHGWVHANSTLAKELGVTL